MSSGKQFIFSGLMWDNLGVFSCI